MYSIKIITELIHQVAHTLMGCDRSLLLLLHQLKLREKKKVYIISSNTTSSSFLQSPQ